MNTNTTTNKGFTNTTTNKGLKNSLHPHKI